MVPFHLLLVQSHKLFSATFSKGAAVIAESVSMTGNGATTRPGLQPHSVHLRCQPQLSNCIPLDASHCTLVGKGLITPAMLTIPQQFVKQNTPSKTNLKPFSANFWKSVTSVVDDVFSFSLMLEFCTTLLRSAVASTCKHNFLCTLFCDFENNFSWSCCIQTEFQETGLFIPISTPNDACVPETGSEWSGLHGGQNTVKQQTNELHPQASPTRCKLPLLTWQLSWAKLQSLVWHRCWLQIQSIGDESDAQSDSELSFSCNGEQQMNQIDRPDQISWP